MSRVGYTKRSAVWLRKKSARSSAYSTWTSTRVFYICLCVFTLISRICMVCHRIKQNGRVSHIKRDISTPSMINWTIWTVKWNTIAPQYHQHHTQNRHVEVCSIRDRNWQIVLLCLVLLLWQILLGKRRCNKNTLVELEPKHKRSNKNSKTVDFSRMFQFHSVFLNAGTSVAWHDICCRSTARRLRQIQRVQVQSTKSREKILRHGSSTCKVTSTHTHTHTTYLIYTYSLPTWETRLHISHDLYTHVNHLFRIQISANAGIIQMIIDS